jgi:ferrochelatase
MNFPIYWGNRNWHPFLVDVLRQMRRDGVKRGLAFVTSAYSSYSGCRQYRENIADACAELGPGAPEVDKLRVFYNHPGFIQALTDTVCQALEGFSQDERQTVRFLATAHSIPASMARTSDYEQQLRETASLVAAQAGLADWDLVYQSRSGPPAQAWLGPDILDYLQNARSQGIRNILVSPLGFLSDHLEVLYDLDTEAAGLARQLGIRMIRAATVGTHPVFVSMVCKLIRERIFPGEPRLAVGNFGPSHDHCRVDCCAVVPQAGRPLVSEVPCASQRS